MLREAFLNTFYTCGIVVGVLATLVVVKWSWHYLFAPKNGLPHKIEPIGPIRAEPTAIEPIVSEPVPIEPIRPEPEQKAFVARPPQRVAQEIPATPPEPEIETIECGNCGQEIRSPRDTRKSSPMVDVYQCEHCGATVGVPVD